jgi:hypothetical protein
MNVDSVRGIEAKTGGVRPQPRLRSERVLSLDEREEISRGLACQRRLKIDPLATVEN